MIATFASLGAIDFVLCPGSRSGPLAHALAEAASADPPLGAPRVNLHVRIDERSAAFLALGIARAHALAGALKPVMVVTTSGTAVGNLMPAMMEAHHSGVPLVLLTADRPGELRGVGANQTTDQVGVFGTFARWSADASAPVSGEAPGRAARLAAKAVRVALGEPRNGDGIGMSGPVHLDLEFSEPLSPDGGVWPEVEISENTPTMGIPVVDGEEPAPLPAVERGIVIAGDAAGDVARQVAEAHGWPLLAEPTSGARAGHAAIAGYLALLASDRGKALAQQIHQVVVIGRPTLSRPVQKLIDDAPALLVAAHGARWREAPRHANVIRPDVPEAWTVRGDSAPALRDSTWLSQWREAGAERASKAEGWNAELVAHAWLGSVRPGDTGVIGSSGPIRAVDRLAPVWKPGTMPVLVANRGLSGIDGTVSTAVGLALASAAPVSALMGDVTFLHDVGGLLIGPHERRPRLRIVVVNDGGGTIFSRLEHAAANPRHFERVFTTPHGVDLASVCAGYGVPHTAVRSVTALKTALAAPVEGFEVIEAVLH
jgi:2-succinyl-5-enolpyruvyl-6-hydroxy-3-cyclohexene-1-carboxylate synthase